MNNAELENWALRIVDRVRAGQIVEDSRVELKAMLIEPSKAARRIAGHSNAARGEPILWLIGVDEFARSVPGVAVSDFATWWNQVKVEFDGMVPRLTELAVPIGEATVLALLFDTSRAPFLVRNPKYGGSGETVRWETPWREGTQIRSAERSELIRLLVPATSVPAVRIRNGSITLYDGSYDRNLYLELHLYVIPANENRVVIPFHDCRVELGLPEERFNLPFSEPFLTPPREQEFGAGHFVEGRSTSHTVTGTSSEIILSGPGEMFVRSNALVEPRAVQNYEALRVFVTMKPVWSDIGLALQADFRRFPSDSQHTTWRLVAMAF